MTENKEKNEVKEQPRCWIPNRGMPEFVPDTEIRRLRAVIAEKDALIEKFKAYDAERKAYYEGIVRDYNDMKQYCNEFNDALKKVCSDNDFDKSDLKRCKKLFKQWVSYKLDALRFQETLSRALSHLNTDIAADIVRLDSLVDRLPTFADIELFTDALSRLRSHADDLRGYLKRTPNT